VEPVCSKNFFRVRNKRRVEIASVSCDIFASGQGDLGFVSLVKIDDETGDSTRLDFFTPVKTVEGSFKEYVFNSLTRVSVGAGNTLAILAKDSDGMRSLTCKISGELVIFR
jgi:hypothetical protein